MKGSVQSRDMLSRLGLFALFLMCGVSIFAHPMFIPGGLQIIYRIGLPILFLLVAALSNRNEHLKKYFHVLFAFFVASFVYLLDYLILSFDLYWSSGSVMDAYVSYNLTSTLFIFLPIVLLTKASVSDMASIYLEQGKLRLGLVIGLATFVVYLATSVPAATWVFGGRNVTLEHLISWTPWILAFVLSNGLREEVWFRGLFLKKYESFLGANTSNLLQAIIFALAHAPEVYAPSVLILVVITFLLGLAFGAVMQRTGSLLGPALFHAGADIPVMLARFSNL